jgi:UDP-glucose 4-epimerase
VVVRLFNTVGPRQTGRYGMVVPTFVRQALRGEPITVYGDGTQSRSFTHVLDVVRGLVGLMLTDKSHGQVWNIGNNEECSILQLAQEIKAAAGSRSPIELIPYEKAYEPGFEDMPRRVPDTGKIHGLLGWEPQVNRERIIRDVLAFVRETERV